MMRRSFLLPGAILSLVASLPALPSLAQTKPDTQVPAESRSQAHAIVQQLLREGKIISSSDVKRGMHGVARSVFQGTTIEEFPVEVLGVLSRVQGGGDVVLIKVLGGTVVKRESGIIAGMSGSPVYINGRMLGAIALGWGFPKEPIGGVTPITEMIETSLPDPTRTKDVSPSGKTSPAPDAPKQNATETTALEYRPKTALKVAGHTIKRMVVSRDRKRYALSGSPTAATMTMRPATTLLQISGFQQSSLPRLRQMFEPYGIEPIIGPSSKKTGVHPSFKPGSAIGVQLVSGDMDETAVGTITFRWGQRILAFGHPMFGQGAASLPMASAYVHEIFPSYQRSFKLASPVDVMGALQQDTQFAIGGTVGMKADTIPMTVALHDPERQIARTYHVQVMKDPVLTPQLISVVASEAIETTLGLTSDKMVRVGLNIDIDNAPPIVRQNYLYSNSVVTGAALADLGQTLALTQMNEFARGSIRKVDLDVVVEQARKTARIKQIFANRNRVKAGESVQVSVVMEPTDTPGKTLTRTFQFSVPEDAETGVMRVGAATAADYWPLEVRVGGPPPQPTNLQELISAWSKVGASNELLVQASTERTFLKVDRQKVSNPAPSWLKLLRTSSSTSIGAYNEIETRQATTDYSLFGAQFLSIPIEGLRHPDKANAPTPSAAAGDTPTTSTTQPKTIEITPSDDGDGNDGGTSTSFGSTLNGAFPLDADGFNYERTFRTSHFLNQLKEWQRLAAEYARNNQRAINWAEKEQVIPSREKPDNPITPSITSATPLPTPGAGAGSTPTPAPTPTPTPNPNSKTIARPAQSWVQTGTADFLGGDFAQTFATNEGLIRLAPTTKLLATTSEPFGWSITSDGRGNTYLGTGSKARITRINANGEQSVFYDGPEVAVTALTTDPAGNVYAGVTPAGRIYKFSPDGQRTTLFDSGQTFIWALEWDASGHLLIGTGGEMGRIYHQTDAGIKELAHLPQKHVRAISVRGNDLYVGAGDEGVLYRVDATTGNATALYQAAESTSKKAVDTEILSVAATPNGVYFGTSGVGTIYRWTSEAGVIPLYASPQQSVYALRYVGKDAVSGRLYAATGDQGVVYQIQPGHDANDTRVARILEPTQLQALSLAVEPDSGHLLIGTGNNAAAFRVALQDTTMGSFTSSVFDAKNIVQWGALRMIGQGATVETRTGNTVDPDPSWSGWKPVSANEIGELQVTSPAARYLQYRVRLSNSTQGGSAATDQGPNVSRVEVVYRTKNSPPSVGLASPHGGEYWSGKKKVNWIGKDPDNDPLRYQLSISADDGKTWKAVDLDDATSTSNDIDTTKWADGTYRLKVEASDATRNPEDPQRDESISLPFIIDNAAPKIVSANLVRSANTGTNAAVRLEAVATDALSPIAGAEWRFVPEEKTEPAKTSTPTTKPAIASTPALGSSSTPKKADSSNPKTNDKAKPTATEPKTTPVDSTKTVTDTSSTDTTKDTKKDKDDDWQAVAATDGIFDSRRESITALVTLPVATTATSATSDTKAASTSSPATRKVELRVHDAAGNTATMILPWPSG